MISNSNPIIMKAKKDNNVVNWQIADKLGCSENTIVRIFRHPLTKEQTDTIISVINQIAEERERKRCQEHQNQCG